MIALIFTGVWEGAHTQSSPQACFGQELFLPPSWYVRAYEEESGTAT